MDPNEKFNPLYVTKFFDSYIKVTGDYFVNTSVPISASVNLTCFYEGIITANYKFPFQTYQNFTLKNNLRSNKVFRKL